MDRETNTIKRMLNNLTFDEMERAWSLFYKWGENTMKERRVRTKDWKQWIKDNKQRGRNVIDTFQQLA